VPTLADPAESVTAGRDALDHWRRYPWYDSEADAVERIDVSRPWWLDWEWPDWFDWDWNFSGGSGSSWSWPGTLFQVVAWSIIALLLIGLIYMLFRAYKKRAGGLTGSDKDERTEAENHRERIESLPFPVRAARSDLLAAARQCYQQGDYGEASKYLFSYELVQLDKHRIIRLARGKTNRQYVREIGASGGLRPLVVQTMIVFEDFFFGNHTIDRAQFESCWSRLAQFEAHVAEGA
jgi:hypothetical protein